MGLASMHKKLNDVLFSEMLAGRRFVLVVDEAQDLEGPVLETIRLLSNFETPHAKLMEIVLAGQPQLAEKLAQRGLSQLRQRIAIFGHLEPLSAVEVTCYIEHRLKVAGYSGAPLFAPDALALIAEQSQGIPREINNICFNALLLGAARRHQTISAKIAREAKQHQTIGAEIARVVLPSITVDSIVPLPQTKGSAPAVAPSQSLGEPFIEARREISELIARRAYELFESSGYTHGHAHEDWLRAESEILLQAAVDVTETETGFTVRADVPGFGEKDLEVRVAPRSLCITGKRHESSDQKEGTAIYSERTSTHIFRVLSLPAEIDRDTVNATVSHGLLEIKLLKAGLSKKVPLAKAATV
jgi:HSP20 family molecular chaperone IbpA